MSNKSPSRARLAASLMVVLMAALVSAGPQQQQQQEPDSNIPLRRVKDIANDNNYTNMADDGEPGQQAMRPLVDVDRHQGKSNVDVHVPAVFDMSKHMDSETGRSKLDLSVLQGLVTVNKDRRLDQSGQLSGPVKVTVFGIPVYQGQTSFNPLPLQDLNVTLSQTRAALADRAETMSSQFLNNLRQTQERFLNNLTDYFSRLSSTIRNGPTSHSHELPPPSQPPRDTRQQQPATPNERGQQVAENNQIDRSPIRSASAELSRPRQ